MRFSGQRNAGMLLAVLLVCSMPLSAASTDISPDRPLTLDECITYALEHHNSILAAERDYAGSQANVKKARSGYMPNITVGTTYNTSGYDGASGNNPGRNNSSDQQAQIGIRQTIFDGGRTRTAINQATAMQRASDADIERTVQERILSVTTAYFEVLRTRRLADIADQSITEAEEQRKLIQARIDAGDAAPVDIYPVEVQIANSRLRKLQADNNVRVAASTLRNAMGITNNTDLRLTDVQEPDWHVDSLDVCVATAIDSRPELVRSEALVDSASASVSYARLQRIPVPSAGISYDRGLTGTGYDSQWSVGIGLSMNLFDGGSAQADVESAQSGLDSAMLRRDQSKLDITREVEESYLNLNSSIERLQASKPNVELAEKNLEVANERYKQGLAIPLEVVSAQVSHADAQAGYAQALYECYIAHARLEKAMGRRGY